MAKATLVAAILKSREASEAADEALQASKRCSWIDCSHHALALGAALRSTSARLHCRVAAAIRDTHCMGGSPAAGWLEPGKAEHDQGRTAAKEHQFADTSASFPGRIQEVREDTAPRTPWAHAGLTAALLN